MASVTTDIWQFQVGLSERLLAWSGASVGGGLLLALLGNRFWRGVGAQCMGWGGIDAAIAGFGLTQARANANAPDAHTPERQAQERDKLRRVLWLNFGLDVLYINGGAALALTRGRRDRFAAGTGWGIILQGSFLLIFDLIHALLLREP